MLGESPDPEAYWLLSRVAIQQVAWDEARSGSPRGAHSGTRIPSSPTRLRSSARPDAPNAIRPSSSRSRARGMPGRSSARATELGGLQLPPAAVPDWAEPKVMHTLSRTDDGRMHQETRVEGQVFDAVVQYAFGSGDRGLTPIGRDEDGESL